MQTITTSSSTVKAKLAVALFGLAHLVTVAGANSECDRDEVVMFQLPETKVEFHPKFSEPLVEAGSQTQPSAMHHKHKQIPGPLTSDLLGYDPHVFVHRLLACVFIGFLVWTFTYHCVSHRLSQHEPWQWTMARAYFKPLKHKSKDSDGSASKDESKDQEAAITAVKSGPRWKGDTANHKDQGTPEQTIPEYIKAALPTDAEAAATVKANSFEAMPPGIGLCGCSAGLTKFMKQPARDFSRKKAFEESCVVVSSSKDAMSSPMVDLAMSLVPFPVQQPPYAHIVDGHPDFTGTWLCVRAEGQMAELVNDYGMGYVMQGLAKGYGYGAGYVKRIYKHEGNRINWREIGLGFDNTVSFEVPSSDVAMGDCLQTAQWDKVQPHVMICVSRDSQKAKPLTWSTSWHFLVDANTLHIKSRSGAGHVGTWVYEREDRISPA